MAMVLAGGLLGFWAAVIGFTVFGLDPLMALMIWAASGPVGAALALLALLPRPQAGRDGLDGSATAA